jgi:hypothetical protein
MTIDKTLITHIVAELIVICGLAFYYHKKCSGLQLQINDLNSKLEKMNGINYLNTIKRHEQFENQTVQHINKIYSILNNNVGNLNLNNGTNSLNMNNISNSDILRTNNDSIIRENFYSHSNESASLLSQQTQLQQKPQVSNPLMNTLSMLGPLTTMFKVVMEPKPPHPNEIFENIDIKTQLNNQQKIVEVEDDDINSETLDNELKDELNDLRSNVTSAMNTPIMTPRLALTSSVPTLDMCENGVCKLNFDNNKNEDTEQSDQLTPNCENKDNNITLLNIDKNKLETDKEVTSEKSSPLRYISQPETKRGRPKKNVQTQ